MHYCFKTWCDYCTSDSFLPTRSNSTQPVVVLLRWLIWHRKPSGFIPPRNAPLRNANYMHSRMTTKDCSRSRPRCWKNARVQKVQPPRASTHPPPDAYPSHPHHHHQVAPSRAMQWKGEKKSALSMSTTLWKGIHNTYTDGFYYKCIIISFDDLYYSSLCCGLGSTTIINRGSRTDGAYWNWIKFINTIWSSKKRERKYDSLARNSSERHAASKIRINTHRRGRTGAERNGSEGDTYN